ncbi:MAG TPA: GDSL-type esterase/lipase family protein [Puia sp.]|jgi:lysophospholipase L1-like esterase|nr:GDSL-type esterase/lipase family protein [Puia sp.]
MKIKIVLSSVISLLLIFADTTFVKAQPFISDIQNFKKQDSINPPPQHPILFVGSSSFTKWTDVQSYFPKYTIINRGFGGSSLPDIIRYANDIIFPYHPKQVVIYCGDNDLAFSDSVTSRMVFNRVRKLFLLIREKMPNENIVYISIKPSPSRVRLIPKVVEANNMIKQFLAEQKNALFVDVYHLMLDKDGKPIDDIFIQDKLHMNAKGYAIWQKAIEPYLLKN